MGNIGSSDLMQTTSGVQTTPTPEPQQQPIAPPPPPIVAPPPPSMDFSNLNFGNSNMDVGFNNPLANLDWSSTNLEGISNIPSSPPPDVAGEKARASELQLQQSGMLTANPLPSLPSISNVGAAPFSGSINWNAIPGGFQPLPQVAGGKKRLYQLSKFHGGINQKSSPRDISDAECQEATNVTVSQVGRIKLLGDIKSTSSEIILTTLSDTENPSPGYGLYVFKSGYSLASTPVQGDYTINVSQDGGVSQLRDNTGTTGSNVSFTDATCDTTNTDATVTMDSTALLAVGLDVSGTGISAGAQVLSITNATTFELTSAATASNTNTTLTFTSPVNTLTISNTATHVAPTFYAAGNGLYASNANLLHAGHANDTRKVAMLVYRKDMNDNETVSGWQTGEALLTSPDVGTSTDDVTMVDSFADEGDFGSMSVFIDPNGSGNWGSSSGIVYSFYVSYLFDNGCETGLSFMGTDTLTDEKLDFNVSLKHQNGDEIGGDKRIHGARIYFREAGSVERYMLAEISLPDGVRGALDSTFIPWDLTDDPVYALGAGSTPAHITFESPPEVYTYVSLNGYYANEMYDKSSDLTTVAPVPHEVRYRTATVGSNGAVFIGCVSFRGKVITDGMMYSMPNKPGVFPELNIFDSPSSDGTPITALLAFKDKILQFKQDALYIVNISNPSQFYTEASFRNCGIMNPCQAFHTPFGVIFANYIGCFIYDGTKVISLTSGKFSIANWGISEGSITDTITENKDAVNVPCVGYDPRSQSIIVLKDIGDDADKDVSPYHSDEAWVYNMGTQSWTEGTEMITNENGNRHTNFIISPNGYLSICQNGEEALKTYNIGVGSQAVTYQTKDMDFGLPSQTKKLFKIYITYKGTPPATITWRKDGSSTALGFTETNWEAAGVTDYEIATLVPDDAAEAVGWYSMSLYMNGSPSVNFEINDISILYRPRPIK
jgi:hypothetical protein